MDYNPDYNPIDEADEVGAVFDVEVIESIGTGLYWIRLQDTNTGEIEDVPINGADVVYWWSRGVGRCDCVRWRAFNESRQRLFIDIPCSQTRMRLLGIWSRGGEQLHSGE